MRYSSIPSTHELTEHIVHAENDRSEEEDAYGHDGEDDGIICDELSFHVS